MGRRTRLLPLKRTNDQGWGLIDNESEVIIDESFRQRHSGWAVGGTS